MSKECRGGGGEGERERERGRGIRYDIYQHIQISWILSMVYDATGGKLVSSRCGQLYLCKKEVREINRLMHCKQKREERGR